MPKKIVQLSVFVSSPSEQSTQREIVSEVCAEMNIDRGARDGFVVDVRRWETHARPGGGPDPQSLINRQMDLDFDIYVGMIGNSFGTPTSKFGSGTEEEFECAKARYDSGDLKEILIYFQNPKSAPGDIVASELFRIEGFKEKLKSSGVFYWGFDGADDFKVLFSRHLSRSITSVLESGEADNTLLDKVDIEGAAAASSFGVFDPIANLTSLNHEADLGYFDLLSDATTAMERVRNIFDLMTGRVSSFGNAISEVTDEMTRAALNSRVDPKRARPLLRKFAKIMDDYSSTFVETLPELSDRLGEVADKAGRALRIAEADGMLSNSERETFLAATTEFKCSVDSLIPKIESSTVNISSIPRITSDINRAKRKVLAAHTDLMGVLARSSDQLLVLIRDAQERL